MVKTITASAGHILTDGEVYGKTLYLAEDIDASAFREITEEEYAAVVADNMSGELPPMPSAATDEATVEDYQAALAEMGVNL